MCISDSRYAMLDWAVPGHVLWCDAMLHHVSVSHSYRCCRTACKTRRLVIQPNTVRVCQVCAIANLEDIRAYVHVHTHTHTGTGTGTRTRIRVHVHVPLNHFQ